MMAGNVLLVVGAVMVFGAIAGFPILDELAPCGFLEFSCAGGRVLLFWAMVGLGALTLVAGLMISVMGATAGTRAFRSYAGTGLGYAKGGGRFAVGEVKRRARR